MDIWMQRTKTLLGEDAMLRLQQAHIIVFGLGGVGSFAAEALARCGVGALTLVDADSISESNINRQLYALHSTVGENKTEAAKKRILDINPYCRVRILTAFYEADKAEQFFDVQYDFCLDDDRYIPIRKRDKKEIVQKYYNKRNAIVQTEG